MNSDTIKMNSDTTVYPDTNEPNTVVIFYVTCKDCNKLLLDYYEFHTCSKDYHNYKYNTHENKTGHKEYTLKSLVRNYICGECAEAWSYELELSQWAKRHAAVTGHSYFGFEQITKSMYDCD